MRAFFFLIFLFCTTAGFMFASPAELEADECLPYVICNWLVVDLSVPEDGCEVTVTTDDVVSQYGTSCGFRPTLSIYGSSTFGLGLHTVRVRARYGSRSATCTTRVRVEDNIAPELECEDITTYVYNLNNLPTPGNFYTATDNCGIDFTISYYDPTGGYGTSSMFAAVADEGGNSSNCSGKFSIRPLFSPYCGVNANTFLSHINRVEVGAASPKIINESGHDSGYGFYVNHKALIEGNGETSIKLEPGYTFYSYRMYWRVYIDLNADGDFSDTGEMVYQWNGVGSHTGSFIAPAYPGLGDYRMRIVMSYGGYASACPSGTVWGEVEDYTVQFYLFYIDWRDGQTKSAQVDRAQIFPNPLSVGELPQLKLEADHAIRQIVVSNSLGQEMSSIPITHNDAQQLELDSRKMQERGLYLVTAIDGNGQRLWTKRWLVQ